jgi:hypothetical protein
MNRRREIMEKRDKDMKRRKESNGEKNQTEKERVYIKGEER